MQIPNSYKQSALDAFIEFYKKDIRDLQFMVINCLNPEDVAIQPDGSIAVASHYSKTFIPIACEVMLFVQAALIEKAMIRPEIFDTGIMAALKASFGNESYFATGAEWGVSEQSFANRINEYIKCTTTKITTGASFPDDIEVFDSAEGRKSGMFADCVITQEKLKKLESYRNVVEVAKDINKGDAAVDIGNAGLKIYRDIKNQTYPFLSGSVMVFDRMNKNMCPYCGGAYKGLFTKRCSKCGTEKGEAEAFAMEFFKTPLNYPPGVF